MGTTNEKGSALLIVDVQVGIIDGFSAYRGGDVLGKINTLFDRARASGVPVIFVGEAYKQHRVLTNHGSGGHPNLLASDILGPLG